MTEGTDRADASGREAVAAVVSRDEDNEMSNELNCRRYLVEFTTTISVTVDIEADDEDAAADLAWQPAQDYLDTVYGDSRSVRAHASLDGIGASAVRLVSS